MTDIVVCAGSFNRRRLVERLVTSSRVSAGPYTLRFAIADGGSTDGSKEYLAAQPDVDLLEGDLEGAVKNYNLAFARALDLGASYICIMNDDDAFLPDSRVLVDCAQTLQADPELGACCFQTQLRSGGKGAWDCERWRDKIYPNKGIISRKALMAVARAQGDQEGQKFWDPQHRTYASDTASGLWLYRLGFGVVTDQSWRVIDGMCQDGLRHKNTHEYKTADAFNLEWNVDGCADYRRAEAERFGGVLR